MRIGQSSLILKGAHIGAGAIVGANTVLPGNRVYERQSIFAGNPAKKVRSGVAWDRDSILTPPALERVRAVSDAIKELPPLPVLR